MTPEERATARARRDEMQIWLEEPIWHPVGRSDFGQLLADADALDAALSVSEQQTAALRQDNQRLREKALRTLRWMEATTAGPNPRPVGKFEVAPYITALRAALSVQPKEPDGE